MRTIGILGGMGPESTAELYLEIIRVFQQEYGAKYDSDFPPILIYSLPLPDVVEGLENESAVVSLLIQGVKKLEQMGADFIVIACNTVQVYLFQMRQAVKIPILSIPEETLLEIKGQKYSKVGLLATELTYISKLFDLESINFGIDLIKPEPIQQKILTTVIMNILAGNKSPSDKEKLLEIIQYLSLKESEAIILGCTDLSLLLNQEDSNLKLFDTIKILARAAVRECRQNIYKP